MGWCFALHIYPEDEFAIFDLEDWEVVWGANRGKILDEYNREITTKEMLGKIQDRYHPADPRTTPHGYSSWEDFYTQNHARPGPNNLCRSKIDGTHCTGHGKGTWDLMVGEFS